LSTVSATTTTTIPGVSLVARHRRRHPPVFELALSQDGVVVRQPDAAPQQIAWDRVREWELQAHRDGALLTLRGDGAESALVVPGWTVAALGELLRDITTQVPADPAPAPTAAPAPPVTTRPTSLVGPAPAPATSRAQRRRSRRRMQLSWKVVTALVLLGLVAAAVAVVLLQSAGVIHWAFLGPTG
jgi:hypothetical protein